jgi:flagellum-specific ATP synthase
LLNALAAEIESISENTLHGRVAAVQGMVVEIAGPVRSMRVGTRLDIEDPGLRGAGRSGLVACEVVGFRGDRAIALPLDPIDGIRMGCRAIIAREQPSIHPCDAWLGRVLNGQAEPMDGVDFLARGAQAYPLRASPPPPHRRSRVGAPIDLGVRALNTFATCCKGQRMGIFAGSGVGKSVLFSMLARNADADVTVIGLIGERGREVQEFLEDDLGTDGLKRAVVIVATSDEPPVVRRQAAQVTMAVAEYFRDQGKNVLLMMDSLTRFAMAQREIGLATGEPPTAKGYTPTVFSELPRLLERAGPGEKGSGDITGLFTVLVDGDDHNEPVADAVRSIVDGHIVMERSIAERGRYPAINVLKSVSRTMPRAADPEYLPVITRARSLMATFSDMEELIRLGAYRAGSDPTVDEAIEKHGALEAFLGQKKDEMTSLVEGYQALERIVLGGDQDALPNV